MTSDRYFTGKPCHNGHIAERFTSNRTCIECQRDKNISKSNRPLYQQWRLMIGRCHKPGHYGYSKYGHKGIKVCDRWHKYVNFVADVGEKPEGMTLDRIDGTGNYEPSNCRWATLQQQANNRSNTRFLTINGEKVALADAARAAGLTQKLVLTRIAVLGWSDEEAVSKPASFKARDGKHRNSRKTHCKHGHALTGDNLYQRASGKRECRTCIRARQGLGTGAD